MRVTFDFEDEVDRRLMVEAKRDGHKNRSAVIRKAIMFFLDHKSSLDKPVQNIPNRNRHKEPDSEAMD